MNEYEIDDLARRFGYGETPNLMAGATVLHRLRQWTNRNSDGWPYWQLPSKAASRLMDLLHAADRFDPQDCTEAELKKAYTPIKTFLTKQGVNHDEIFENDLPVYHVTLTASLVVEIRAADEHAAEAKALTRHPTLGGVEVTDINQPDLTRS
jgi:hypothetical protein